MPTARLETYSSYYCYYGLVGEIVEERKFDEISILCVSLK